MTRAPQSGDIFTAEDFDLVLETVKARSEKFPEENPTVTMFMVLTHLGDRYTKVECIEQEWQGVKRDVIFMDGDTHPKCPNGHPLRQGPTLKLGWVEVE